MISARPAAFAVTGLALALALSGCAAESSPMAHHAPSSMRSSDDSGRANKADIEFAQMMIVHHQGALDMARLAPTRAARPEVKELAANIEGAQKPEIDMMTGWLHSWGADPLGSDGAMPGMDHGSMPGMDHGAKSDSGMDGMGDQAMAQLEGATGPDFDRLFLQLMTAHHQDAVTMAKTEIAAGSSKAAVQLAHKIVVDQSQEIALMGKLQSAK